MRGQDSESEHRDTMLGRVVNQLYPDSVVLSTCYRHRTTVFDIRILDMIV